MNDGVREWVEKAEGDFCTALREYRARKNRNHDAVCFHAQQCVEKYLKKARLAVEAMKRKRAEVRETLGLSC